MKSVLKTIGLALCAASATFLLAACGSRHVSRDISPEGVAGEVVFPDPSRIVLKGGTFPNLDDLLLVKAGMTKDQMYQLLGRPHFHEGYVGVREWDYLFHFRQDDAVVTCQFKVIYDREMTARSFHWAPASCADLLALRPQPVEVRERTFRLSADALFQFGRYGIEDMLPQGKRELDGIANQLVTAKNMKITVVGHTDRIGTDADNQVLSERRARTVRGYLIDRAVPSSSIAAEGRGESQPVKQCVDANQAELIACLAPNRRVEIMASATTGE